MPILRTANPIVLPNRIVSHRWSLFSSLIIVILLMLTGCEDHGKIIWSKEVVSPNSEWSVVAETRQWGGPGAAYVATTVYLKRQGRHAQSPVQSLLSSLAREKPPITIMNFSNEDARSIAGPSVKIEWRDQTHVNIIYGSGAKVDFQAIQCAGIYISAAPAASL
jgi:hypothetical protein